MMDLQSSGCVEICARLSFTFNACIYVKYGREDRLIPCCNMSVSVLVLIFLFVCIACTENSCQISRETNSTIQYNAAEASCPSIGMATAVSARPTQHFQHT